MNVFALTVSHTDRDGETTEEVIEEVLTAPLVFASFAAANKSALEFIAEVYASINEDSDEKMDAPTSLQWMKLDTEDDILRETQWDLWNEEMGFKLRITQMRLGDDEEEVTNPTAH